jgi:uncharacterized protein (TIGR02246 family)
MIRKLLCVAVIFLCGAKLLIAADPAAADKQAILAVDEQYVKAFNSGNIEAATKFFSENAEYFTDDGRVLRGREEIKKALTEQFKEMGDAKLNLKVYGLELSADSQSATERGISIVTTQEGIQEPSSYVAKFTRNGTQWQVNEVKEQPQAASAEHLENMAWLIGDWTDQSEDASIRMKTEWGLDRAFIVTRFAASGGKLRDLKGIQYLGWDPARQEIHSWYFDSDGGYGSGRWKREGKSWLEESSGMTPSGETASATRIYTPKDEKTFTLRVTNRQIAGKAQEDVPELTIRKNESEQSASAREHL